MIIKNLLVGLTLLVPATSIQHVQAQPSGAPSPVVLSPNSCTDLHRACIEYPEIEGYGCNEFLLSRIDVAGSESFLDITGISCNECKQRYQQKGCFRPASKEECQELRAVCKGEIPSTRDSSSYEACGSYEIRGCKPYGIEVEVIDEIPPSPPLDPLPLIAIPPDVTPPSTPIGKEHQLIDELCETHRSHASQVRPYGSNRRRQIDQHRRNRQRKQRQRQSPPPPHGNRFKMGFTR